jgi:hypothetical protein
MATLTGAALLALPLQGLARSDGTGSWHERHGHAERGPEHGLVEKYDRFAGSDRNARELVHGLRNDSQIDLRKDGKTTTFTPATGKMGWGNVAHALALAKASLADHGIRNPSPEQIKAALNGGTIMTKSGERVTLPGVLKLRASGMGWGEIAHKLGFKLGDLKRPDKHDKHADRKHDDKRHDHKHGDRHHGDKRHDHKHADRHDGKHHDHKHVHDRPHHKHADWRDHRKHVDWKHDGRPDFHRAKFERPHRSEKFERPEKFEKPHRPERPERPERHHRGR